MIDRIADGRTDLVFEYRSAGYPANSMTPLHVALCKTGRPDDVRILKILLTHGADPNVVTREGAATGAFMRDCRTKGETPLHRAAAFGTEESSIQLLVDAGAIVDAKDMSGDSPLTWASWHHRSAGVLRKLC